MGSTRWAKSKFTPKSLFSLNSGRLSPAPELSRWGQMHHSDAVGIDVVTDVSGEKPFGLGWIKFPPHGEVKLHTHEGSHILICFAGDGAVKVQVKDRSKHSRIRSHSICLGQCYSIESLVPHSVHAGGDGLLLLVIGNDYRHAVSTDRLQMVVGE